MLRDFSAPALSAGLLAGFVGFASTFAVIIRGLSAVGASPEQAASGLMAVSVAMGVCGVLLSLGTRLPISIAWSTPGAALLASATWTGGFAQAVGAFIVTGLLISTAGLFRPLGRWVQAIPAPLASAMLAGVLLNLCLAPARAVAVSPASGVPIVLAWAVVARFNRLWAVPAAVLVAGVMVATTVSLPSGMGAALWPHPVFVMPAFSVPALIGIALPLFIVAMASQNIPGLAVLSANGYRPSPSGLFRWTGAFTVLCAPFGGHAVCMAAITAAISSGPDAHPDRGRRYWAAAVAGVVYVVLGLAAGAAALFISAAPPVLIEAVTGLALLGAFGGALMGAVTDNAYREAAVVTLLVSGSGLSFFGIGGAFWGLLAGLALVGLGRLRR